MLIKIYSAAPVGIDAVKVTIEVHSKPGFEYVMVGLPDVSVKESHERIMAALTVNGLEALHRSYTINMAPADIKKEGSLYDLPLAIGMLAGGEKMKSKELEHYMMVGELSLDGSLQPIRGALPIALCARKEGFKGLILPEANAEEAAVVDGLEVYGLKDLKEVIHFLNGEPKDELKPDEPWLPTKVDTQALFDELAFPTDVDFSDVRGQFKVRRAVEIAAAGGHNMIMIGPPGAGKSMIAKRIPTILPPLTLEEALETTKIHSIVGLTNKKKGASSSLIVQRPFRSPHHTITDTALVGGGQNPHPGEISLAHNGVLFLDELPEYKRSALEVMRQPLEDRHITVARTKETPVRAAITGRITLLIRVLARRHRCIVICRRSADRCWIVLISSVRSKPFRMSSYATHNPVRRRRLSVSVCCVPELFRPSVSSTANSSIATR